MGRLPWLGWTGLLAVLLGGCASGPLLDNPGLFRPGGDIPVVENPVFVPLGPTSYGHVFEKAVDVVSEYFEIAEFNRYDGRIETFPRIAPGFERWWMPGDPDFYQRLYATLQTVRHRCTVLIQPAENGGFFIQVIIFKELEDSPRPLRAVGGDAIFRAEPTVERQFEVIDPAHFEGNWIPLGRDTALEQVILQRLKKCM